MTSRSLTRKRRAMLAACSLLCGTFIAAGAVQQDALGAQAKTATRSGQYQVGWMYIPRLREQVWGMPIYSGTSNTELDLGIGWFPSSATPGMAGNFAVVGHRTEGRAPFLYIENLVVGDEIVVQTRDAWLVYRLIRQEIVTPQSTWVLDPIPSPVSRENAAVSPHLITLMTCTPRGTTRQRWVWWGILSEVGRAGTPPHAVESPKQLERGHIDNKLRARRLLSECNGIARCRPFV